MIFGLSFGEIAANVCVFALTGGGIYLVGRPESGKRRWGYLMALAAQPIWLVMSFQKDLWGIFGLTLFCCYGWGRGCWLHWVKREGTNTPGAHSPLPDVTSVSTPGSVHRKLEAVDP